MERLYSVIDGYWVFGSEAAVYFIRMDDPTKTEKILITDKDMRLAFSLGVTDLRLLRPGILNQEGKFERLDRVLLELMRPPPQEADKYHGYLSSLVELAKKETNFHLARAVVLGSRTYLIWDRYCELCVVERDKEGQIKYWYWDSPVPTLKDFVPFWTRAAIVMEDIQHLNRMFIFYPDYGDCYYLHVSGTIVPFTVRGSLGLVYLYAGVTRLSPEEPYVPYFAIKVLPSLLNLPLPYVFGAECLRGQIPDADFNRLLHDCVVVIMQAEELRFLYRTVGCVGRARLAPLDLTDEEELLVICVDLRDFQLRLVKITSHEVQRLPYGRVLYATELKNCRCDIEVIQLKEKRHV